jgi:hypothetical protein
MDQNNGSGLFHMNSFRRADVNTGFTVDAHILINLCFLIFQGDCRSRALTHACFASGTFTGVNDCNQQIHSILYVGQEVKNRFRYCVLKVKKPAQDDNHKKQKHPTRKHPVRDERYKIIF